MSVSRQSVLDALREIEYPGFDRDIVACGVVRELRVDGGEVELTLDVGPGDPAVLPPIEQAAKSRLETLNGVTRLVVRSGTGRAGADALPMAGSRPSVAAAGALDSGLIPGVRHTLAVASGKGGVGKSTVAVNLAVALARNGRRVGLLDADVYGPSIPLMTGIVARPELGPDQKIVPFERFGVSVMSLGFLVEAGSAVIWRGPMVMKAIEQLLGGVSWGRLDVLVVDMPPGTGDAQLTLSQKVRLAGAVIVTTPQDVALADVIKGVAMFRKVGVPVLGVVENMSYFECPHCSERTEIFGHGGGSAEAERMGLPCLGEIPLAAEIRASGDAGTPLVALDPESPRARPFNDIAARVLEALPTTADPDAGSSPGLLERFRKLGRTRAD